MAKSMGHVRGVCESITEVGRTKAKRTSADDVKKNQKPNSIWLIQNETKNVFQHQLMDKN